MYTYSGALREERVAFESEKSSLLARLSEEREAFEAEKRRLDAVRVGYEAAKDEHGKALSVKRERIAEQVFNIDSCMCTPCESPYICVYNN
jgi:hypothetical protein